MLLERLREYAGQLGMPPPMYQRKAVRYTVLLDASGQCLGIIDSAGETNKQGIILDVPDCKRSVNIRPFLLCDNAEYTLGLAREGSKEARVQKQHQAFVALVQDCALATEEPTVVAVTHFLATLDQAALSLPKDFDSSARMTFEVGGTLPIELETVRAYWARIAAAGDTTQSMQCLVCGNELPPVKRLPISIRGIPGGQPTGMALISANEVAFESYGLSASLIAPTCEDCGQRFGNALNALLRDRETHINIGTLSYIFWSKNPLPFSVASLLSDAQSDDIRAFLQTPWKGQGYPTSPDTTAFYATVLTARGPRVVLRDWMESTLDHLANNLQRFFDLQCIVDSNGTVRWFSLWHLNKATVREGSKEEAVPLVGSALLHLAFHGGSLPLSLLTLVFRRIRSEHNVLPSQAALIKMVLLTQADISWVGHISNSLDDRRTLMTQLDLTSKDPAYLCGRLLAEVEEIQTTALGRDLSSTVTDRYFGTASSAPASVYGRLLRGAQTHLSKLKSDPAKSGAAYRLETSLQAILAGFTNKQFPSTLTLIEQGRFALGFHHQRAADRQAAIAGAAAKKAAQGQKQDPALSATAPVDGALFAESSDIVATTELATESVDTGLN